MVRQRCTVFATLVAGLLIGSAAAWSGEPDITANFGQQQHLLASSDPQLARNKKLVDDFWRNEMQSGDATRASAYVATSYVSHDPDGASGLDQLKTAIAKRPQAAPAHNIQALINIIAEGDLVLLETLNGIQDPQKPDVSYENVDHDVYRISGGKIVEHWGSARITLAQIEAAIHSKGAALPPLPGAASADAVPMAQQVAKLLRSRDPHLARNKRVVFDFWRTVVESGHVDQAARYMTKGYIQHNPVIPSGRDAFVQMFAKLVPRKSGIDEGVDGLMFLIAEHNDVALVQSHKEGNTDAVTFDVFRVENGQVAEHWDSVRGAAEVGVVQNGQSGLQPLRAANSKTPVASP